MNRLTCLAVVGLSALLSFDVGAARAAAIMNTVFLSNDVAGSEVTYVVQVQSLVARHVAKVRILLPPDTDTAHAVLGRIMIGSTSIAGNLSPLGLDGLLVDLTGAYNIAAATPIRIELFKLKNPDAGSHEIHVSTLDRLNHILETFPPSASTASPGVAATSRRCSPARASRVEPRVARRRCRSTPRSSSSA